MDKTSDYSQPFLRPLQGVPKPPQRLYGCAELFQLKTPWISLVGARDMRPWLKEWMENEVYPVLKALNIGVVSGGARGVDQWAHSTALRAGQPSVAVIPSGLNRVYPASLAAFFGKKRFYLLSEYEPDVEMRKHHFHHRNRIIAALSPLTFVVQANLRSGSMITAKEAMQLGRVVVTLPGAVDDPAFSGNNQLLFDGALMVRNRWDLAQVIQQHCLEN